MPDHRVRVITAEHDAGLGQHRRGRFPGLVQVLVGQFFELWHERADVAALRVELFALDDWVEDPDSNIYYSSEEIARHILTSKYKSGGIVLLHVGARQVDPIYPKLPDIIDGLIDQGYQITAVSDLIENMQS